MSSSASASLFSNAASSSSRNDHFSSHFDFESPLDAIALYTRQMHQHTKRQMDLAARSTRRRANATNSHSSSHSNSNSVAGSTAGLGPTPPLTPRGSDFGSSRRESL